MGAERQLIVALQDDVDEFAHEVRKADRPNPFIRRVSTSAHEIVTRKRLFQQSRDAATTVADALKLLLASQDDPPAVKRLLDQADAKTTDSAIVYRLGDGWSGNVRSITTRHRTALERKKVPEPSCLPSESSPWQPASPPS